MVFQAMIIKHDPSLVVVQRSVVGGRQINHNTPCMMPEEVCIIK